VPLAKQQVLNLASDLTATANRAVRRVPQRHRLLISALLTAVAAAAAWSHITGTAGSRGDADVNILMIGNSFTGPIPPLLSGLLTSSGRNARVAMIAPGGWTLQQHAASRGTLDKIGSQRWTHVVLQEQSQIPALPERNTMMLPAVRALSAEIRRQHAAVILYQTWGKRTGDRENVKEDSFTAMQARLRAGYRAASDETGASIAAAGDAWELVLSRSTGFSLWAPDGSHPSHHGAYIAACALFAAITQQSPVGLTFTAGLPSADVRLLQQAVAEAAGLSRP